MPEAGTGGNLHAHTFFSYNAYGYSPSKYAWLARKAGMAVAGVVDLDVLDALDEFFDAGRLIGLKTCVSLESRVFVPEFASRVNSPGEPGIAYHMGVGFSKAVRLPFLAEMRARRGACATWWSASTASCSPSNSTSRTMSFRSPPTAMPPSAISAKHTNARRHSYFPMPRSAPRLEGKARPRSVRRVQAAEFDPCQDHEEGGVGYVQPGKVRSRSWRT